MEPNVAIYLLIFSCNETKKALTLFTATINSVKAFWKLYILRELNVTFYREIFF